MKMKSAIRRPFATGLMVTLLGVACLQAQAHSPASGSGKPQVELKCVSYGKGPMLDCVVDVKRAEGTPLDGAQLMLGAMMPSMPMAVWSPQMPSVL